MAASQLSGNPLYQVSPAADKAYVYLHLGGEFIPAGLLTMHQDGHEVVFTFAHGRRYLERRDAAPVDPLQLPLGQAEYHAGGVFRAFQDASPDGWGRHLLDRATEWDGVVPSDQIIQVMSRGKYLQLRRVGYRASETCKHSVFLTSHFTLLARTVAEMYKERQIERYIRLIT